MKTLLLTILFFVVLQVNATIYYVDSSITDTNVASAIPDFTTYNPTTFSTSTGSSNVFKTVADVNAKTNYAAGDQILFKCGDTWREQIAVTSSGTTGNPILYGSFGSGAKPRILGSSIETSWTNVSGNIWMSAGTYTDPATVGSYGCSIFFLETNGNVSWGRVKKSNTAACITEYDWTVSSSHIYIYSPTDPNIRYSGVEIPQRSIAIRLWSKQYLTISGLEIAYTGYFGIAESGSEAVAHGLTIQNCHIHHIGKKLYGMGIESFYSDVLIRNNEIDNSGRRNISLNLYGNGLAVSSIVIENNTLHDSFHTTGVDIATSGTSTLSNITVRKNLIYNELTSDVDGVETIGSGFGHLSSQNYVNTVDGVYYYNNIFKGVTSNGFSIGTGNGCNNVYFYNNTFYGVSPHMTETGRQLFLIEDGGNITLKNNIIYNDVNIANNSTYSVISSTSNAGTVVLDNNLFYNTSATRLMIWKGTSYSVSQWSTYKTASGQDANSILGSNPQFISPTDYNLQATSPAINAGVNVGLTTDYIGNALEGIPDIGAYEYITTYVPPVVRTKGISAGNGKAWGKNGIPYGI